VTTVKIFDRELEKDSKCICVIECKKAEREVWGIEWRKHSDLLKPRRDDVNNLRRNEPS
jgi:hypothetical protein